MSYEVTDENRQELFQLLLDLLLVFDEVCQKNNIQYFADGGTALGAIRHKGFIPWDDDVDIAMPRRDYEKLKAVAAAGAFQSPYFFQNPSTDQGCSKGFQGSETATLQRFPSWTIP